MGRSSYRLDALGLFIAGLINTFLASLDAGVILAPGSVAQQANVVLRAEWIANNVFVWQSGWLFWFAVTISFSWSFFALGRHLDNSRPWVSLAIGLAIIAAAVDIVGVVVNIALLPDLATAVANSSNSESIALELLFLSMESLANGLTNVAAFGLYSVAGLLLLPAIFTTASYPRWLAWLGTMEWGIAMIATLLLVIAPSWATAPLLISFALYAPWIWGSAIWLLQHK